MLFWKACSSLILATSNTLHHERLCLFLARRFAVPHFARSSKEVHIVFGSLGQNPCTPKVFEQSREYAEHLVSLGH